MKRTAFTLVELLVVIGIIAILIGLLIPALQRGREAVMRMESQNKLRQMGMALQTAASAQGKMPPSVGNYPGTTGPNGSLFTHLLPYLEQDNLYKAVAANPNLTPPNVNLYVSSLDPTADAIGGAVSYASNALVFGDKGATLAGITDGTSNTVVLMERYCQANNGGTSTVHTWNSTAAPNTSSSGPNWLFPTNQTPPFQVKPALIDAQEVLPQGLSSSGLQVCLGDGSVRNVSPSISQSTWNAACSPAGGEVLNSDW